MTDPHTCASFNLKGKGSDPSPVFVDVDVFAESRRKALELNDATQLTAPRRVPFQHLMVAEEEASADCSPEHGYGLA